MGAKVSRWTRFTSTGAAPVWSHIVSSIGSMASSPSRSTGLQARGLRRTRQPSSSPGQASPSGCRRRWSNASSFPRRPSVTPGCSPTTCWWRCQMTRCWRWCRRACRSDHPMALWLLASQPCPPPPPQAARAKTTTGKDTVLPAWKGVQFMRPPRRILETRKPIAASARSPACPGTARRPAWTSAPASGRTSCATGRGSCPSAPALPAPGR